MSAKIYKHPRDILFNEPIIREGKPVWLEVGSGSVAYGDHADLPSQANGWAYVWVQISTDALANLAS